MTKQFSFKEQLEIGQAGEDEFLARYPTELSVHPDRDGDFICSESGSKLELKTDMYDMNKTENFFIERWSVIEKKKPGSLWQAHEHGCDIFCYLFAQNRTYFRIEDIPRAIELVEKWIEDENPKMSEIRNRGYKTGGYKMPRHILESVYEEFSWEEEE